MPHVRADAYFAMIPEWLLDTPISARAVRVWCVLQRHADKQTKEARPGRHALARRARCSLSTLDRAIDELISVGAVTVEHRQRPGSQELDTNVYTLHMLGIVTGDDTSARDLSSPVTTPIAISDDTSGGKVSSPETTPIVTGGEVTRVKNQSKNEPESRTREPRARTPRDDVFDAVVRFCDAPPSTKSERARVGAAVKELIAWSAECGMSLDKLASEIDNRAERYRQRAPRYRRTPKALLDNWSSLAAEQRSARAGYTPRQLAAIARGDDPAMVEPARVYTPRELAEMARAGRAQREARDGSG